MGDPNSEWVALDGETYPIPANVIKSYSDSATLAEQGFTTKNAKAEEVITATNNACVKCISARIKPASLYLMLSGTGTIAGDHIANARVFRGWRFNQNRPCQRVASTTSSYDAWRRVVIAFAHLNISPLLTIVRALKSGSSYFLVRCIY